LKIVQLSDQVAAAIAAGEVIERPASVVKELIENSIDARASQILIRIAGGGKELVEVHDDGIGIPAEDVRLAVARYSTSKLRAVKDLTNISTLGFRGEALASIGAVSHLEIVSRSKRAEDGRKLNVDGGRVGELETIGSAPGTVIRVRNLFYNTPARRKYLKTDTTEKRWISRLISRYAMVYPNIQFELESSGKRSFLSPGSGDGLEAIAAVFGVKIAKRMIALVEAPNAPFKVSGFISAPDLNRSNRNELNLYINRRWIKDARLSAAILQAYHGLLMVGRFPIVVLNLSIPPDSVDVNVHPAKAEVRFVDSSHVFTVLQRFVRATLLGQAPVPVMHGAQTISPGDGMARPVAALFPIEDQRETRLASQPALPGSDVPLLRAVGQVGASFLVAEGPDGIYLIDQHAAHERVLFELLLSEMENGHVARQALLEAVKVELSVEEADILRPNLSVLAMIGFDLEEFGGNSFIIRSIPALLLDHTPEAMLKAAVEEIEEDERPLEKENEKRLAARVCKRAAIKAGQILSLDEQQRLIRDLEACKVPRNCPHGRPTMIHLSVASLERQFGRR
jgi:DNA mismatch repair protein MutL